MNAATLNEGNSTCYRLSLYAAIALVFMIPISTGLTNAFLSFLVIFWFLGGKLWEKIQLVKANPVTHPFVILFLVFLAGAFYSAAGNRQEIFSMLNKMGKLLYLPFLIPLMQHQKWRQYALWAFLSAMVLTLILSFFKVYVGLPMISGFTLAAVFKDHIFTNLMMAFASFMVGHYLFETSNAWVRFGLFCLILGFIYHIFWMSHGRSGQIIFLSLWVLFFLQRGYLKELIYSVLALGFLLVFALDYSTFFYNRVLEGLTDFFKFQAGNVNTSIGERLQFMTHTWELCQQHLWFGFGTGSYTSVYGAHAVANELIETRNPHNEYLNILFQVGIMGLLAWLYLFWTIIRNSRNLSVPERFFAEGMCLAMLIGCLANSWLMDFTSGYFFVILIAVFFGSFKTKEGLNHG